MTAVVYPFRQTKDDGAELRYSLRSLANLTDFNGQVVIVGDCPSWLTGVIHIPGNRHNNKPANVRGNIRIAAEHPAVPDEFLLFNADFFVLQPGYMPTVEHRGTLTEQLAELADKATWFGRSLTNTVDWFRRYTDICDPLSFEGHKPLPVNKAAMAEAIRQTAGFRSHLPPQSRTVYANLAGLAATQGPDRKTYATTTGDSWKRWPVVSTSDATWASGHPVGEYIRSRFPEPSPFEVS